MLTLYTHIYEKIPEKSALRRSGKCKIFLEGHMFLAILGGIPIFFLDFWIVWKDMLLVLEACPSKKMCISRSSLRLKVHFFKDFLIIRDSNNNCVWTGLKNEMKKNLFAPRALKTVRECVHQASLNRKKEIIDMISINKIKNCQNVSEYCRKNGQFHPNLNFLILFVTL